MTGVKKVPKRLCVGDIHGSYDKLLDVLNRAGYNPDEDELYSVGDFCDRGLQNIDTLRYLLTLPHFYPVFGNHDMWLFSYLQGVTGSGPGMTRGEFECWYEWNGGRKTYREFKALNDPEFNKQVYEFLKDIPYARFLEGGWEIVHSPCPQAVYTNRKPSLPLDQITLTNMIESGLVFDTEYDQSLWDRAIIRGSRDFRTIEGQRGFLTNLYADERAQLEYIQVVGHTPIQYPFYDKENKVLAIDTGGFCDKDGWGLDGYITVVDLDTLEYWQSGKDRTFRFEDK